MLAYPVFLALTAEEGHRGPVNSGSYNSPQVLCE